MRPVWPLSALLLLACTPSGPRTEPDEPDDEPDELEDDGPGHLQGVHPLGGAAALLRFDNSLALTTGPGGHVWTTRPPDDLAIRMSFAERPPAVADGVAVFALGRGYTGAAGLDIATGALRWHNPAVTKPGSYMGQRVRSEPGDGHVLHQLHNREELRRRPTTADLRRFLAGSFPWDPAGSFLISATVEPTARAWLVDGNVIDAAWRAATGDAPFWSYPPAVERRN